MDGKHVLDHIHTSDRLGSADILGRVSSFERRRIAVACTFREARVLVLVALASKYDHNRPTLQMRQSRA